MAIAGLTISGHEVPWPSGISPEARALLAQFHEVDVRGGTVTPDPRDKEAWRRFVDDANAAILKNSPMYAIAERSGVSCENATFGGVKVYIAVPDSIAANRTSKVYLEMHGGGMVLLEGEGTRRGALREAERLGVRTISIDYRVPPDWPYPAALDDCLAAYGALIESYDPADVIVGGVSGGGNLAAALPLRIRDAGLPQPAGVILLTPEVDLTESGDTFDTLFGLDPVLNGRITDQIRAYAPDADLSDPYLSPIFADFTGGYPPTFLQSGTRDMFLSNTVRMHRALRAAGVTADLHVWEGMPHGGFMGAPEDDEIAAEMRAFMDRCWHSRDGLN
jgi:epsilon-lactone hydrolase